MTMQDLLEARQRQAQWEEALATEQNYRKSQQRKMSEQLTQLKSQCSQMQKDVTAKERELGEARTQLRKRVDFLTSKNYVLEKDKCSLQNAAEQARVLATEQETKVRKLESKLQEMRTAMSHEKQRADSLSVCLPAVRHLSLFSVCLRCLINPPRLLTLLWFLVFGLSSGNCEIWNAKFLQRRQIRRLR